MTRYTQGKPQTTHAQNLKWGAMIVSECFGDHDAKDKGCRICDRAEQCKGLQEGAYHANK
jgi:hypothetical protein